MSDSQIAKIIMALNNLSGARTHLNDAIKEGGDIAATLSPLLEKIKSCEDELRIIQYQKGNQ